MAGLLFTDDGVLREPAQTGPARVVARIAGAGGDASPRLTCGEIEHEIAALGGNAFELRDGAGLRRGSFQPFRLRRGGRLRLGELVAALHGRPWSHEGWAFSAPDGSRVEATVTGAGEATGPAARTGSALRPSDSFVVVLDAPDGGEARELPAEMLALGCWLIASWHRAPAGDHVLTAGAGARTVAAMRLAVG